MINPVNEPKQLYLKSFFILLLNLLIFLEFNPLYAQGWERYYGDASAHMKFNSVRQTIDNGYILLGENSLEGDLAMVKTDVNGDTLWAKRYEGGFDSRGYSVQQTDDGGYIATGERTFSAAAGGAQLILMRTNALGDTLWTKHFGDSGNERGFSVIQTEDGGFIIAGSTINSFGLPAFEFHGYLIKTDSAGNQLWDQRYSSSNTLELFDVKQTTDQGFILAGRNGSASVYVIKTDSVGNEEWSEDYTSIWGYYQAEFIQQANDGGYVITGTDGSDDIMLIKTDSAGIPEWDESYVSAGPDAPISIDKTTDGGYIIGGIKNAFGTDEGFYAVKVDSLGNKDWDRVYGNSDDDKLYEIRQTNDGGYILAGATLSTSTPGFLGYVVKIDSNGYSWSNELSGHIYVDSNANCIFDVSEDPRRNILLEITPGPIYTTTDSNGYYSVRLDTGEYDINLIELYPGYWDINCPNSPDYYTVDIDANYTTIDTLDFASIADILCPGMYVDISTPRLNIAGAAVNYTVYYCNVGNLDAADSFIEVVFDSNIVANSATIPWNLPQSGNVYIFEIGTVAPGDCGSFDITVSVDTNITIGRTLCAEAHIYPDSSCLPVNPGWDGASIEVDLECVNGNTDVEYKIRNFGTNATDGEPVKYVIMEDDIVMVIDSSIHLPANDSVVFYRTANGATIRLQAEQRPNHPGLSMPSTVLEACGTDSAGSFSLGFVNTQPHDDGNPFVSIDCQEVVGSYDPNDKYGFPVGVGLEKYITEFDEIEYKIRFQNTGTDTAFRVVIRDTLPEFLDVTTVVNGASSHPHQFKIYGPGILQWTFNPISLPDSNTNEPLSHGYVKFKVQQKESNPIGSVIKNRAAIYFDYNAPVITNTEFHTIGEDFIEIRLDNPSAILETFKNFDFNVYPNPFSTQATVELQGLENETVNFELYNVMGTKVRSYQLQHVHSFIIKRGELAKGTYIFRMTTSSGQSASGKLIVY